MILKLAFLLGFVWVMLMLVQRDRLSMDLASMALLLLAGALAVSLSPYLVERVAGFLDFGTPAMAIVGVAVACLSSVCLALAVMVTDLKRHRAQVTRQLARLELQLLEASQASTKPCAIPATAQHGQGHDVTTAKGHANRPVTGP